MKFSALSTSVLAGLATTATLANAAQMPSCYPDAPKTGILSPAPKTKITLGKPFTFFYCSDTYFRGHTDTLTVVLTDRNTTLDGAIVLTANAKPNNSGGQAYSLNLTVTSSYMGKNASLYLGAFELADTYYGTRSFTGFQPVQIIVPPGSN
ncbi:hypothetical protein OC846_004528 [Tilletia horrida]|uniref:Secreted protein n=1 Tax=Tilletia horrida TaxID=155126 RepID=A0AAN6GNF3_9BASI|nr:hypothetical protein OC845_004701 [Tilletia horrida]KAK0548279.1 hypothetical protein OC846_004528 [Tilletia horrida]